MIPGSSSLVPHHTAGSPVFFNSTGGPGAPLTGPHSPFMHSPYAPPPGHPSAPQSPLLQSSVRPTATPRSRTRARAVAHTQSLTQAPPYTLARGPHAHAAGHGAYSAAADGGGGGMQSPLRNGGVNAFNQYSVYGASNNASALASGTHNFTVAHGGSVETPVALLPMSASTAVLSSPRRTRRAAAAAAACTGAAHVSPATMHAYPHLTRSGTATPSAAAQIGRAHV